MITGVTGSLTVIAVNGWMNHPTGFRLVDGQAVDVHPFSALFGNAYFWHELVHMYLAGYIVTGLRARERATRGAMLRGRWGRYQQHRARDPARGRRDRRAGAGRSSATGSPATSPTRQPAKLAAIEGLQRHDDAARRCTSSAGTTATTCASGSRSRACSRSSRKHDPNATVEGLDAVPPRGPPAELRAVNVTRFAFQTMVGIGTVLAALGVAVRATCASARDGCPSRAGSTGRSCSRGPASVVALIAGWVTTEVGRQPWVVLRVMRTSEAVTRGSGVPVAYATLIVVYAALAVARLVGAAAPRRSPLGPVEPAPCPCSRPRASPRSRSPMTLDAFPLVLIVAGLTAYGVLGGADFGAGLLVAARRAGRPRAGRCATTPTTRSARSGRRTTSG